MLQFSSHFPSNRIFLSPKKCLTLGRNAVIVIIPKKKLLRDISETKRIYWTCFYHFTTNSLEMEKDIQGRDAPRVVDIKIRQREK